MEDFVDIIGYEGLYKINQSGQVLGVKSQKLLKPKVHMGYFSVDLSNDGKTTHFIHKLLALHFLPNPDELPNVDHIDGCKKNNSLNNLEWVTHIKNNSNKAWESSSGENNISLTRNNTFRVHFTLNNKSYSRTFKTLDEAKVNKNNYIIANGLDNKYYNF